MIERVYYMEDENQVEELYNFLFLYKNQDYKFYKFLRGVECYGLFDTEEKYWCLQIIMRENFVPYSNFLALY
jgi:hypothetical protein